MDGSGTDPDSLPVELDALQRSVWNAVYPYKDRLINIAFSGGLDSTALLSVAASLRPRMGLSLRALHVNHGWNEKSEDWAAHCESVARALTVPCETIQLGSNLALESGSADFTESSREARARAARYHWFSEMVDPEDVLLTGHHLDDQAETFILRLMRGSSINGLGAMRPQQSLNRLQVLRPFLGISRNSLAQWVSDKNLQVLDDPSNSNIAFDRNFLRHTILPRLKSRWPETTQILARAAVHSQGTQMLLDEVAADDLARCALVRPHCYLSDLGAASIPALFKLGRMRLLNVLRFWMRTCTLQTPSERALGEFIRQLETAGPESSPSLRLGPLVFREYREGLFLVPLPGRDDAGVPESQLWDGTSVNIHGPDIELIPERKMASGLRASLLDDGVVELRWRRGSTRVTLQGRGPHRHALRKILQELSMPPWERERIPLIFINGQFACMPQVVIEESCRAGAGEVGLEIHLRDLRKPSD